MFKNYWTKSKNQPVDWGLLGFPPNVALMEAEKMYHRYSNLLEKSTSRWILLASPIKDGNFSFVAAWQSWRRSRNTNIKSLLTDEEDNRSQQFILQPILLNISYFLLKHIFRVICFFPFQHSARKMGFPATILELFRFFTPVCLSWFTFTRTWFTFSDFSHQLTWVVVQNWADAMIDGKKCQVKN